MASAVDSPHWSSADRRSLRRQVWGRAASSCPQATACSRAVPSGTTRLTRPMDRASSAPTSRPVRIRSRARPWPISRGSRTVPPSTRGTPKRRQNTPKTEPAAATRRSHQMASSRPPATAYPSTAAITGLDSSSRVGPIGPGPSSATRWRSPPAKRLEVGAGTERAAELPVRTATAEESSASKAVKASSRASAVAGSTALRRSGRSMVTTVTGPVPDRPARSTPWSQHGGTGEGMARPPRIRVRRPKTRLTQSTIGSASDYPGRATRSR